jgi:hypothetical protein
MQKKRKDNQNWNHDIWIHTEIDRAREKPNRKLYNSDRKLEWINKETKKVDLYRVSIND